MIDNNLKPSQSKTCSCLEGKICSGCKRKKVLKPLVFIEEPRRLPVPIAVSQYREKKHTHYVQIQEKTERAKKFLKRKISADDNDDSKKYKWNPIRELSKKRQSVKEEQLETKKEKRRQEGEKKRFEKEYRNRRKKEVRWDKDQKKLEGELKRREKEQKKEEDKRLGKTHKKLESRKVQSLPSAKTEKVRYYVKERAASASPRTGTKYVSVKRDHSCPTRLSNCFYRLCCQFYCYLTCIIFLGVFIICII